METKKRTQAADIAEIATKLDGKVDFSQITFNQILIKEKGESVNDLLFIDRKFGLWFYTSKSDIDGICYLTKGKFPTLVVCEGSNVVYEIKK